jgi:TatA/E family protein of Tat protein translocase
MIGNTEILVILIFALLLFGPQKLPELARSIGKAVAEYKRAAREIEEEVTRELGDARREIREMQDDLNELRAIARDLNIEPRDMSRKELLKEIKKRTS